MSFLQFTYEIIFPAIANLYMLNVLKVPPREVKMTMHGLISSCNFLTLLFMLIADMCFGKVKIFIAAKFLLTVSPLMLTITAIPEFEFVTEIIIYVSLMVYHYFFFAALRALTGPLYEDQFTRPDDERCIEIFLFIQYMLNKMCGFIAYIVAPILRNDRKCFGRLTCYTIPFSVITILHLMSAVFLFFIRKRIEEIGVIGNTFTPVFKVLLVSFDFCNT